MERPHAGAWRKSGRVPVVGKGGGLGMVGLTRSRVRRGLRFSRRWNRGGGGRESFLRDGVFPAKPLHFPGGREADFHNGVGACLESRHSHRIPNLPLPVSFCVLHAWCSLPKREAAFTDIDFSRVAATVHRPGSRLRGGPNTYFCQEMSRTDIRGWGSFP